MSYFDTYSAIVSACQEIAEDDGQEYLDFIPKSLELAQLRLMDEVDLDLLNSQVELTCVANNRLIVKPAEYRFINSVFIVTSSGRETPLKKASTSYLRDFWPVATSVGEPLYYSEDYDANYILVAPTPSSAYVLRTDMRQDTSFISAGNPSNLFTQHCANALFYAAMKEQSQFMKFPAGMQLFEQQYLNAVQGINNRGRRTRRQDGGTASTNESGQNTLLGTK